MLQSEDYLREITIIFFSHLKLIINVFLICISIAVGIAYFYPAQYKVETSFLFIGNRINRSPDSLETTELKVVELTREDLLSEVEMLRSYDVVEKAVKAVIEREPDFFKIKGEPLVIKKKVRQIQSRVTTEIIPKTNIVQMKVQTENPEKGIILTNAISDEFIRFRSKIFNPEKAESFFHQQTDEYSKSLKDKENELIKIVKTFNSANPNQEIESNLLIINSMREQMDLVRTQAIELRQFVIYLEKLIDSKEQHYFSFIDDLSISNFSEKLQHLVIEKGTLMRTFSPESVKVKRIDEQINTTFSQLKSEVAIFLSERQSKLKTLEDTLEQFEAQIISLSDKNVALHTQHILMERINRSISILKQSHDTFSKRWESARISNKWKIGDLFSVRILRKPFCSGVPTFPNKRNMLIIGLLGGFIIGCSTAFLLEFFDHTFKKPEDVEKYAGLPTVFSIPKWDA